MLNNSTINFEEWRALNEENIKPKIPSLVLKVPPKEKSKKKTKKIAKKEKKSVVEAEKEKPAEVPEEATPFYWRRELNFQLTTSMPMSTCLGKTICGGVIFL